MQIILFVILILLVAIIFAIKKDEFPTKTKIGFLLGIVLVVILSVLYEYAKGSQTNENRLTVNAFLQGKTLTCNGVDVTKQSFEYISGTQTFMPLKTNVAQKGLILEVVNCKIKD